MSDRDKKSFMRFDGALLASNLSSFSDRLWMRSLNGSPKIPKAYFVTDDFLCRPITAQTTRVFAIEMPLTAGWLPLWEYWWIVTTLAALIRSLSRFPYSPISKIKIPNRATAEWPGSADSNSIDCLFRFRSSNHLYFYEEKRKWVFKLAHPKL